MEAGAASKEGQGPAALSRQVGCHATEVLDPQAKGPVSGFLIFFFCIITKFYVFSTVLALWNNQADGKENSAYLPPPPAYRQLLLLTLQTGGVLL